MEASESQLHLMSFPLLLVGAYISSILMGRGGGHLIETLIIQEADPEVGTSTNV